MLVLAVYSAGIWIIMPFASKILPEICTRNLVFKYYKSVYNFLLIALGLVH